jgi:hypothetical protein
MRLPQVASGRDAVPGAPVLSPMGSSPLAAIRRAALALAALFALALPAWASHLDSGVRGRALYGPTCPVQRVGESCTRPYQATIAIRSEPANRVVARARSSPAGYFRASLAPGRYLLVPQSGRPYPRSTPQPIVVHPHRYTFVTISYDSGIR